ncbi:hypothetical protein WA1_27015 [Scytonema hofmannii PCC 7110]|uniref:pPIWI-RE three-gene island domain-containing protein n=1 Tax=Scytonema hofmannii PCC 7110 TaxID=128403 RepID=A0A139X686_9CYAN|nr:hypothetical protein [Scytonema hofmannii]KYC40194.1 hypothetical protein WA1_27015 [Scytonema hofmannii PCC 7110]
MRNISNWSNELCKALRQSEDLKNHVQLNLRDANTKVQQREISRLARLIADVELGITLLREVAPEDPATSVSALLSGYRFPVPALANDENWLLVQKARFYLVRRKGKQWEHCLSEYINIPEMIRIFKLTDSSDAPQLIPCSTYPNRLQLYRRSLSTTPPHQTRKVKLATSGYWYAKIFHKGKSPIEVPINISETIANLALSPQISFQRTRSRRNHSHTVNLEELRQDAREMDAKLLQAGYDSENYDERLRGIALQLYNSLTNEFQSGKKFQLEQLLHVVGLLNVGKSTLLEVLIYHFAKQGYRCALIVNDVVTAVRLASLFWRGLGIPAAPVLGSDRFQQLEKVYKSILVTKGEEIEKGANHPAWRWFSPVCPILALVQSEEKWEFGNEPCHNLYQKSNIPQDLEDEDLEEWAEDDTEDKYTCPLYYKCPRHQLERDIATAKLWVLTPASFIHTRVPRQLFAEKFTFAEAVYQECEFLFVDEADRVQVQLDEAFAPDEVLLDNSENSFLNKLGLNLAPIYNSNRVSMTASWFEAWTNAQYDAQKAINRICPLVYKKAKLVEWLGHDPFTGHSLFARIIGELVNQSQGETQIKKSKQTRSQRNKAQQSKVLAGLTSVAQRKQQQQYVEELGEFLQAPLSRSRGKELANIALSLLSTESESWVLQEVGEWWLRWLQTHNLPIPDEIQFEELKLKTHFAILVTVLHNRLVFLVDNLSTIYRFIDLHDTSLALVYRPSRDYLPVIPSAPVGNILGFRYTRDRANKGGKLEYFRYVGVGRYLLLNFPTLFAVDDWDGPHTVLISGTSYAPGSPAYHIREQPKVLLEPAARAAGDAGIGKSEFFFSPQRNPVKEYIALSGLPPTARKKAAGEMVKAICYKPGQAKSFLDELLETLEKKEQEDWEKWGNRKRLLLLTNSYDEAELVETILKPLYYRVENIDDIAVLRRDNAPAELRGIRRNQIRELKELPTRIVIAPLMALERGHNILNDRRIAAFGAAVFLCRPMPVPDDWQTTVQQLNDWALQNASNPSLYDALLTSGEPLTLTKVEDKFYQAAIAEMIELNCRGMSFKQLTPKERSVLCWTQLVSIWQVIGRLVRGGVPCIIHFLDTKFAPQSAEDEQDNEYTSLLVGILKELQNAVNPQGKSPWETTLATSLYGAFLNALKQTKKLDYEQS